METVPLDAAVNGMGRLQLVDRLHDVTWNSLFIGWVELSDGHHREIIPLEKPVVTGPDQDNVLSLQFQGVHGQSIVDPDFEMVVQISTHAGVVTLTVISLDTPFQFHSLEYPAHLLSVPSGLSGGAVYVPHLQGIMIPARYDAGFMRNGQNVWSMIADVQRWWTFESGNLNMPWFGATIGASSVFAHVETSTDCQLHVLGNAFIDHTGRVVSNRHGTTNGARLSSLTPIWLASKGELAYSRKLTLQLVENGYLGMAACYKQLARQRGRYVTLQAKIEQNPEIEKIIGAPDVKIYCYTNRKDEPALRAWSEPVLDGYSKVNTTFAQAATIIDDLYGMGIQKCLILLAGWNRMGYDREHVDMWPPSTPAGGVDGLAHACETARSKGYIFALHDNYDDFYPDAPSFDEQYILKDRDGTLHKGGVWDGGLCYITCPAKREALLNRNMDYITARVPLNGYYFDVITNTSHYECYDETHPITRQQDLAYRRALLKNIRDRKLVVGGERGTDWALPDVAFCEGLSGGGSGYHQGLCYRTGINVPLFYLVYHECVVGYWQHGTPFGREDHANHVLLNLLYAQPASWSIEYAQWDDLKLLIKECYELLGWLHEHTAHHAMTSHQFLTADYMVQHSQFDNQVQVWVNFGLVTFNGDNRVIPPKGFIVQVPGENPIRGIVSRRIEFLS